MPHVVRSHEAQFVTERFTRVADDRILYTFTVEDEATWTRPWTAEMPMQKTVGPMFEHACHEGNRGLYNTLVGACRREESRRGSREEGPEIRAPSSGCL